MRMEVIWANLIVNIKSFYREKAAMFFTIAFPIMLIVLFGLIFSNTDNVNLDLHIQDLDQTPASAALMKQMELNGTFTVHSVDANVTNVTKYMKDNNINFVVIIDKGYQQAYFIRNNTNNTSLNFTFRIVYDPSSSSAQTKMQIVESYFGGMNQYISKTKPFAITSDESIFTKNYTFIDFFVPGIIAMSVMTSSMFGSVSMNAELKQKGVIRKLSTTPITRAEWIRSEEHTSELQSP
jgi:ABC-2 type transport system permease protein